MTIHTLSEPYTVLCPEAPLQELYEIARLRHKHTVLFCVALDLSGVGVRGHWVGLATYQCPSEWSFSFKCDFPEYLEAIKVPGTGARAFLFTRGEALHVIFDI